MENKEITNLGEKLYLLRALYARVWVILDAVCTGKLIVPDTPLNRYYVKLCLLIENLLEAPSLSDIEKDYRRPFETLYNVDDVDWEYDGSVFVSEYFGKIEELWILNGQKIHEDPQVHSFLQQLDRYIEEYQKRKNKIEANFIPAVKKATDEYMKDVGEFKLAELTDKEKVPQK